MIPSSVAHEKRQSGKLFIIAVIVISACTFLGWESKTGKIGKSAVPGAKTFRMTTFTLDQTDIGKRTFQLVYDNQLISRIDLLDEHGNFVETQYAFEYNTNGNLVKHTSSHGEQQKITSYEYDVNGLLMSKAASKNSAGTDHAIFNYVYDQNNIMIEENNLNQNGTLQQQTAFSYPDAYTISSTTSVEKDNQDSEEYHFSKHLRVPRSFNNFYYSFFVSPQFEQYNDHLLEKYVGDFGPEDQAPETCKFQYELDKNGNVIKQAYLFNDQITDIHTYTYEEI